jgi:hypothetical protein
MSRKDIIKKILKEGLNLRKKEDNINLDRQISYAILAIEDLPHHRRKIYKNDILYLRKVLDDYYSKGEPIVLDPDMVQFVKDYSDRYQIKIKNLDMNLLDSN